MDWCLSSPVACFYIAVGFVVTAIGITLFIVELVDWIFGEIKMLRKVFGALAVVVVVLLSFVNRRVFGFLPRRKRNDREAWLDGL